MNRRGFLGRALAGAAAIVGASQMPRVAEAASIRVTDGYGIMINPGSTGSEFHLLVTDPTFSVMRSVVYANDPQTLHLSAGEFTADEINEWMRTSGATIIRGPSVGKAIVHGPGLIEARSGVSNIHYVPIVHPPTFEAMQADCEARGCSFEAIAPVRAYAGHRWADVRHAGELTMWHLDYVGPGGESYIMAQIDAERRSLHEGV